MAATDLLTVAWNHHQAGSFAQAEQLYRQILQANPAHTNAWCLLGGACQSQGKFAEAAQSYQQAIRLDRNYAEAHYHLGLVRRDLRQPEAAIMQFHQALACNPDYDAAAAALATVLAEAEQVTQAVPGQSPISPQMLLYAQGHYNLGVVMSRKGKMPEAISQYRQAIAFNPTLVEAYNNMATSLHQAGRLDEAVDCYHQALQCRPDSAEVHTNLGTALVLLSRLEEGVACYRRAIQLNPNMCEISNNLGEALKELGQIDEALASFERALQLKPGFAQSRWNRSLLWLLRGDLTRGWPEYEWRWTQAGTPPRSFSEPLWDGSPLADRTILLHAEQGLGDTLQFIRYASLVKAMGGYVIGECPPQLQPLLAGLPGIDRVVGRGSALPKFEIQAPLLSLPRILHTTLATIPNAVPYLRPDPRLVENWRKELDAIDGFKVGISWQGSPTYRYDRQRSIPLSQFARLAQLEGVRLISLQRGPGTEQLAAFQSQCPVIDLAGRLDQAGGAFMDTAAVMMNVDLVISSDSAIPHLAAALGVPVWLALPLVPDWRWLLERDDSPWYPSMRLFRQSSFGRWEDVFERMAKELRDVI